MKLCAIMGLGLSYAGTEKEDVNEIIMPILSDSSQGLVGDSLLISLRHSEASIYRSLLGMLQLL